VTVVASRCLALRIPPPSPRPDDPNYIMEPGGKFWWLGTRQGGLRSVRRRCMTMREPDRFFKHDAFISYARADNEKGAVHALHAQLDEFSPLISSMGAISLARRAIAQYGRRCQTANTGGASRCGRPDKYYFRDCGITEVVSRRNGLVPHGCRSRSCYC
jgi:hypothetical protein